MGFFEIVAHCVAPLIMDMKYLGRRGALSLMFFIGGISCLGSLLFKNLSRCASDEVTLCDEVSKVNSRFWLVFFHWSKNFSTWCAIQSCFKSPDGLLSSASLVSLLALQLFTHFLSNCIQHVHGVVHWECARRALALVESLVHWFLALIRKFPGYQTLFLVLPRLLHHLLH